MDGAEGAPPPTPTWPSMHSMAKDQGASEAAQLRRYVRIEVSREATGDRQIGPDPQQQEQVRPICWVAYWYFGDRLSYFPPSASSVSRDDGRSRTPITEGIG